jgi:hypothetical protein
VDGQSSGKARRAREAARPRVLSESPWWARRERGSGGSGRAGGANEVAEPDMLINWTGNSLLSNVIWAFPDSKKPCGNVTFA